MDLDFTDDELQRYSRHILLAEVGGIGQAKLKAARVLVIGAVPGSPLLLYLAAAGSAPSASSMTTRSTCRTCNARLLTRRLGSAWRRRSRGGQRGGDQSGVKLEIHELRLSAENALDIIGLTISSATHG